jgi:hypothetical protein
VVIKIRQRFASTALSDPCKTVRDQLARIEHEVRPGSRIAVGVGSRGISNLPAIAREVCAFVKRCGAQPFIVPAMGSHGGATAEGQQEVLQLNGISAEAVGAPIRASMDVVELPQGSLPHRIFMDRHAYESDGVILINRIKPHTDYHGRYESGLMKMALIGLGKLEGALAIHAYGIAGLRELIGPGARQVLASGRILSGVALVENACHETMIARVLKADEMPEEEPALLDAATRHMARLPVEEIDVLIIDRMGKNISGVGIDPNVTGRMGVRGQPDPATPRIKAIVATDLTDPSHGNAIGVGLADVITRRLHDKIDRGDTYRNVITSSFLERGKIPLVAATDREAFEIALRSCGHIPKGHERIVRILDTLNLEEMYASPPIVEELQHAPHIEITGDRTEMFDENGTLNRF